jgi:hypothetical protein
MAAPDQAVLALLDAGHALVPIPFGCKGPRTDEWQLRENALTGSAAAARFVGMNAGLLHAWSRTCAIDVDNLDTASGWLSARGVDLEALFMRDDAVTVSSGRPNRGKLIYKLPDGVAPLRSLVRDEFKHESGMEWRCASSTGDSMQDVIAGQHPDGMPYAMRGDVAHMPLLPAALLALWQALLLNGAERATASQAKTPGDAIPKGARNDTLTSLAGTMRRRGMSPEAITAALLAENAARCDPPLPEANVCRIARSVSGYAPGTAPPPEAPKETNFPHIWARDTSALLDGDYVVKSCIDESALALIYGPSNSGKTFLSLDLALSVAMNRAWNGHAVHGGLVAYVAAEAGHRVQRRVRAWLDAFGGELADPPFIIVPRVVNLMREAELVAFTDFLVKLASAHRFSLRLVVVDTLARSIPGGDENRGDLSRITLLADALREAAPGCAVLGVHHTGKDAARGTRGHSSLPAAVDWSLAITAQDDGTRLATVDKVRDGVAADFGFRLRVVDLGTDRDGEPVTTCLVEPMVGVTPGRRQRSSEPRGAIQRLVLNVLRALIIKPGEPLPPSLGAAPDYRGVPYSTLRDAVVADLPGDREAFRAREAISRALTTLVVDGHACAREGWVWIP